MATVSVNLRVDAPGFDTLRSDAPKVLRAKQRALTRAAVSTRAFMAREVAKEIGLRVGPVRDTIETKADHQTATVTISGRRIPLIEFSARGPEPSRGRGGGVRYRIGARANRIPRAFIATMPSGHRGVFERADKAGRPQKARLPITEKFGPSLPHIFNKLAPRGLEHGGEVLRKNLEHELNYAFSQKG